MYIDKLGQKLARFCRFAYHFNPSPPSPLLSVPFFLRLTEFYAKNNGQTYLFAYDQRSHQSTVCVLYRIDVRVISPRDTGWTIWSRTRAFRNLPFVYEDFAGINCVVDFVTWWCLIVIIWTLVFFPARNQDSWKKLNFHAIWFLSYPKEKNPVKARTRDFSNWNAAY